MTWYAVIDANSNLVSTGETVADSATLSAKGLSAITLASDPTGQVWNPSTKTFSAPPPKLNSYPKITFIQRFTAAEFMGLKQSTDVNVQFFLYQVENAATVTPQDSTVQPGLNYLVSIGLLTAARAAVIGAN